MTPGVLLAAGAPAAPHALTLPLGGQGPGMVGLLALLAAIGLLPTMVMTLTAFPRVIIVLSILRNAMGLTTTPPNAVLVGLALLVTGFVMQSTLTAIGHQALTPYLAGHLTLVQASSAAWKPLQTFMLHQTRQQDLAFFLHLAHQKPPAQPDLVSPWTLMPAYLLTQLRLAFAMSVFFYVPFVVIDIAVSAVLMAMGMMMVPPTLISLPVKLLLFVLANGWVMVLGALVHSFH